MSVAAKLATLLLEHLSITGRPDLNEVARRLGLRIKEVPLTGAHGALVRSKNAQKGIIAIRESLREPTQKRFTVAHEIGHFIIPYHKELGSVCNANTLGRFASSTPRPELEANEFAAELLLPEKLVRGPFRLKSPSLETIGGVAKEFEAGFSTSVWRFLDLTDEPCAMIWSQNSHAVWSRNSAALSAMVPIRELPAAQSLAGRLFAGQQTPAAARVDPYLWFSRSDADNIHALIEESAHLPNYNAVLTLLWVQKMDQPRGGEDEEPLSDLDPSDFTLNRRRWPN